MRTALRRLLALFSRARLDRELEDEMQAHLELAERDARAGGLSPDAARRDARRRFGGLERIREEHRDARSARWVETLVRDVRFGLRALRRTPALCAAIVLVLAVGIAANTAMFSATRAILLRPLAYGDPDALVIVMHHGRGPVAPANFRDWRDGSRSFSAMGAAEYWRPNIGLDAGPERILGLRVTSETLRLLDVAPLHGRLLDGPGQDPADDHRVVIAHGLWERLFASDPDAIGRTIRLDGHPYTVVGVMPSGFAFPPFWAVGAEAWAPLPLAGRSEDRGANSLRVFARLKPEVSLEQARAEMDAITSRLDAAFPGTNRNVQVVSLKERVVGDTRPAVVVLMAGVVFVLLIACANVAHMLLVRASSRRREVAVRLALGATRAQVVRQFLVESLLLALVSGLAGLALAVVGVRLLALSAPPDVPRAAEITLDAHVFGFLAIVSLLTGVAFGIVPAWQAARSSLADVAKGGRTATPDRRQGRLRDVLVASEIALALVLLAGAGLMIRTLAALQSFDPGFDPRGVLSLAVSVHGTAHAAPERRAGFFVELAERLRDMPGALSASAINHLPLAGDIWTRGFAIEGRPAPPPGEGPHAAYRVVLPGYFETMRVRVAGGRDFAATDTREAPGVVILSESLARRYWPGEDPIGRRIAVGAGEDPEWRTIVGLVADAARDAWGAPPGHEIYLPYLQAADYLEGGESRHTYMTMVVRTSGSPSSLLPGARRAVSALDRHASVSDVTTMDAAVAQELARPRFHLALLTMFGGVALLLAALGIYGVISYAVSRRTQEIGLRLTLGARPSDVRRMVLGQAFARVAVGLIVGLVGALVATRLMGSLLYGVSPGDPTTLGVVSLLLVGVALLASAVPAWRASRIDPVGVLRDG